MNNLTTLSITIDTDLKTKFTTFFKDRGMSLDSAISLILKDFLLRHSTKDVSQMMEKHNLSRREQQVTLLILKGYETREIANKLYVSMDTIHTHIKNIYRKCDIKNKVQLVNILNNIRYE